MSIQGQLTDAPSIYVASLSDYNDGELHGRWIDATLGLDHIEEQVREMLASSPYAASSFARQWGLVAEEWAIHDHSGFQGVKIGEWEQFVTVADLAENIEEHGDAFAAFAAAFDPDQLDQFEDRYRGQWETVEAFAGDWTEDTGGLSNVSEYLQNHIDWGSVAREMEVSGEFYFAKQTNGVYVFENGEV